MTSKPEVPKTQEGPYELVAATDGEPLFTGPSAAKIFDLFEGDFCGKEHLVCNIAYAEGQRPLREALERLIKTCKPYTPSCTRPENMYSLLEAIAEAERLLKGGT